MPNLDRPLRVLFSAPAYWPALAFGGPIWMARGLNEEMVRRGHRVDVLTTTLLDIRRGRSRHTAVADVGGVAVRYLATPARYRWMGVTPSLPLRLRELERPDVAHVFGFRDPLGTAVAAWCHRRDIPYVFEPLGMLQPRSRKVRLKRLLDASLLGWLPQAAAAVVVTSEHERAQVIAAGAPSGRVVVRGNGFPPPAAADAERGALRRALGLRNEKLVLYVGRIARGKGVELLIETVRRLPDVHLALVGPDDRQGVAEAVDAALRDQSTASRIHRLQPSGRPLDLYGDADVFVLPSASESFGMVAAEAAAAGVPVVVTDTCGVAEWLSDDAALVVPYDAEAVCNAVRRVLDDATLRARLSAGGRAVAARISWAAMAERQETIYRDAISDGH